MKRICLAGLLVLAAIHTAAAQPAPKTTWGAPEYPPFDNQLPASVNLGVGFSQSLGKFIPLNIDPAGNVYVLDQNSASYGGSGTPPYVVSTYPATYPAARGVQLNCTTVPTSGGTVTLTENGVSVPWLITAAGTTVIPDVTTGIVSLGTGLTCPYVAAKY